jgi:predicted DNA-binding transcriptional regulator
MQRNLLAITNVDFEATGLLLIIYSAFVKYLRKMGIQKIQHQFFIDFKKAYDSVTREVLYPYGIGEANKNVSD